MYERCNQTIQACAFEVRFNYDRLLHSKKINSLSKVSGFTIRRQIWFGCGIL